MKKHSTDLKTARSVAKKPLHIVVWIASRKFVDYIHELSKNAKKYAANVLTIAHNRKGYDHHFILTEIVSRNYMDVDLIVQGSKILRLKDEYVKFIDSFAIMNLPLKSLPLAYEIEDVSKGFFPHSMHALKNENYRRQLPDLKSLELNT
jgi:hypothetical protein